MTLAADPGRQSPSWALTLLHEFSATGPGGDIVLTARKAVALLVYLALQPTRATRRSVLARLLWEHVNEVQARVSLRQTIAVIRRAESRRGGGLIEIEDDVVRLSKTVVVDVWSREARNAVGQDVGAGLEAIGMAELLPGFEVRDAPAFNEWLGIEQARIRQATVGVLSDILRRARGGRPDPGLGLTTALRLLSFDPFHEAAHRALMDIYAIQGRPALSIQQYRSLSALLWDELQITPEAETKRLYDQIRSGRLQNSRAGEAPRAAAPPPVVSPQTAPRPLPKGIRSSSGAARCRARLRRPRLPMMGLTLGG